MGGKVAVVTGGSMGLGAAAAGALAERGWRVIVDARDGERLAHAVRALGAGDAVIAIPGDVSDPGHRARLVDAVAEAGRLDLLVNNASVLGPSPQPALADYPAAELERVFAVNTFAPLALTGGLIGRLPTPGGVIVNVSSDAAVEAYEGWGGYGASKAALDQITAVVAVEHPALRVYAFDPGDMATDLHRQAAPGEDASDLQSPHEVVPALLRLVAGDLPSGRYRAADLATVAA